MRSKSARTLSSVRRGCKYIESKKRLKIKRSTAKEEILMNSAFVIF